MSGIDEEDVKSIAEEMGVRFVSLDEYLYEDQMPLNTDPDTLYLYPMPMIHFDDDEAERRGWESDATIFYGGGAYDIIYSQNTKASIRVLLAAWTWECAVCFEDGDVSEFIHCPQCHCGVCPVCTMKMVLTPQYISQLHQLGNASNIPPFIAVCPQCRVGWDLDPAFRCGDFKARLDEFNEEQQKMLQWFKKTGPEYTYEADTEASRKQRTKRLKYIQMRSFRKGCRVKLRCLKTQKKWNGKKAVIIGNKMIKNNTIRWPIELMIGGSKTKALIKPCNMKKI